MKRKPRKGEFVCKCNAYKFPHRFGGGRCNGFFVVDDYWQGHYGGGECARCNLLCDDGERTCQVVDGQESVTECPVWQDFVQYNEIKLLGRLGK